MPAMEVRTFPNWTRPGVGMGPRRENQRPLLPQHARHCPVLEAGSGLGFMVYPALEAHESYHVEFQGEGQYQLIYLQMAAGQWRPIFTLRITMPVGSIGMFKEDVQFHVSDFPVGADGVKQFARAFVVPEDFGTPQGAVALRGNVGFRTPAGWDTVYTPVFNNIERPIAPMLVVRVETDWYVARFGVPLCAAARRRHRRRAQPANRAGRLRAARGDHHRAVHGRGDCDPSRIESHLLSGEGGEPCHDASRTALQPALPSREPGPEALEAHEIHTRSSCART